MNEAMKRKLEAIEEVAPDEIDNAMIAATTKEDDESTMSLEEFKRDLESFSGRLIVRMPRSLHKKLTETANIEGVSLNQYIIYKLSK